MTVGKMTVRAVMDEVGIVSPRNVRERLDFFLGMASTQGVVGVHQVNDAGVVVYRSLQLRHRQLVAVFGFVDRDFQRGRTTCLGEGHWPFPPRVRRHEVHTWLAQVTAGGVQRLYPAVRHQHRCIFRTETQVLENQASQFFKTGWRRVRMKFLGFDGRQHGVDHCRVRLEVIRVLPQPHQARLVDQSVKVLVAGFKLTHGSQSLA